MEIISQTETTLIVERYATNNEGKACKETITFTAPGTLGVSEEDPRLRRNQFADGLWFFVSAATDGIFHSLVKCFLIETRNRDGSVDWLYPVDSPYWEILEAPLEDGITLISRQEYEQLKASEDAALEAQNAILLAESEALQQAQVASANATMDALASSTRVSREEISKLFGSHSGSVGV